VFLIFLVSGWCLPAHLAGRRVQKSDGQYPSGRMAKATKNSQKRKL